MVFHHFHSSNSRGFPPLRNCLLPIAWCSLSLQRIRVHLEHSDVTGCLAQRPSGAQPCPAMPSHAQPLSPAMGVSITAASSMVKPSVCLTSGISEDNKSLVGPISSESNNDWATWGSSFHKEELAWTGKARML